MKTIFIISTFIILNSNLFGCETNAALKALAIQIEAQPTPVKPTSKKFERSSKFTQEARDKMNGHFKKTPNKKRYTLNNATKKTAYLEHLK